VVDSHLGARRARAGRVMIRISHVHLPPGLNALARRDPDGELIVLVSAALSPDRQRAAVRTALRAARRAERRAVVLPLPVAGLLAASWLWLRGLLGTLRAHWALTAAVATTAVAAVAVYAVVVPHGHQPASAAGGPAHSRVHGVGPQRSASNGAPSHHAGAAESPSRGPTPGSGTPTPQPTRTAQQRTPGSSPSPRPSASSTPEPSPSATSSKPAPSPSPTPTPKQSSGKCVIILGIWVCL
jgi:hypothetical protein